MNWILTPYTSFGPIDFGMSKNTVEALVGPAKRKKTVASVEVETRGLRMPHVSYNEDMVVEIEIYSDAGNVFINEKPFFEKNTDKIRSYLFSSGEIYEGAGVWVSFELGISTNLFHTLTTPSLAAFCKGYWDRNKSNLKKVG